MSTIVFGISAVKHSVEICTCTAATICCTRYVVVRNTLVPEMQLPALPSTLAVAGVSVDVGRTALED